MDFFGGDQSYESQSDTESDDYFQNDEPPKGIDPELSNHILRTKHALYESTVLLPEPTDEHSQDNELLDEYLKHIGRLYMMTVLCQNGKTNDYHMDEFPEKVRPTITDTLKWLEAFYSKNRIPDTIPYNDYIRNQLYVYPLVQNNYFMKK
jgi:hypothetical protein